MCPRNYATQPNGASSTRTPAKPRTEAVHTPSRYAHHNPPENRGADVPFVQTTSLSEPLIATGQWGNRFRPGSTRPIPAAAPPREATESKKSKARFCYIEPVLQMRVVLKDTALTATWLHDRYQLKMMPISALRTATS